MGSVTRPSRLLRIGITIIIVIAVTVFAMGILHLTHRGRGSGVAEPVSAFLLVISVCLVSRAMKNIASTGRDAGRRYLFMTGMTIIVLITLLAFYLGVYHLTHHGPRSAAIELLSTALLAAAIYLILRAGNELTLVEAQKIRARTWKGILGAASAGALILAGIVYAALHSPA